MEHGKKIMSDESLLVAYAAGEVEGEELTQFEARLASDASLKQQATALSDDYAQLMNGLAAMDKRYRVDERRSLQQVDALLQQWEQEQAEAPAPISIQSWRPPRWAYAAAAMVALFVGFCYWWANNPPDNQVAETPTTEPTQEVAADNQNAPNSDNNLDAGPAPMPLAFEDNSSENSDRISALEQDVVALSNDQVSAKNSSNDIDQ
ncbi:MAG TPA: hypothetical protein VGG19_17425 [Tepidisphaeraceae bacterium]|jgi:anti-sigma-K factor RskA